MKLQILLAILILFWVIGPIAFAKPTPAYLKGALEAEFAKREAMVQTLERSIRGDSQESIQRLVIAYARLAAVYASFGDFEKSKTILLKSIEVAGKLHKSLIDDEEISFSLRESFANLSVLSVIAGDYPSAEANTRKALEQPPAPLFNNKFGRIPKAMLLADLALLGLLRGNLTEQKRNWSLAEVAHEESCKGSRAATKLSGSYFTRSVLIYAQTLALSGKPEQAEVLRERALTLQKSLAGFIDCETWGELASAYDLENNTSKRDECLRERIKSAVFSFGANSDAAGHALYSYARFLIEQNDFECAAMYLEISNENFNESKTVDSLNSQQYQIALCDVRRLLRQINHEPEPAPPPILHAPGLTRVQTQQGTGFSSTPQSILSGCDLTNPVQHCIHKQRECHDVINVIRKDKP